MLNTNKTFIGNSFSVSNGVQGGGVLSTVLFAMYIDGMLKTLEKEALVVI